MSSPRYMSLMSALVVVMVVLAGWDTEGLVGDDGDSHGSGGPLEATWGGDQRALTDTRVVVVTPRLIPAETSTGRIKLH